MKTVDVIRRSGRNLRSAKMRTILTALAIAVGGFTLAITFAAGNGVNRYADTLIQSNFDPSELLVAKDSQLFGNESGAGGSAPQEYDESLTSVRGGPSTVQIKRLNDEDVAKLRENPRIEQVREGYQVPLQFITREDQKKYTGTVEAYNPAQQPELRAGTFIDESGGDKSVLLPDVYLDLLGFESPEAAIGQTVYLQVRRTSLAADTIQQLMNTGTSPSTVDQQQIQQLISGEQKNDRYTIQGVTKRPATSLSFSAQAILVGDADARDLSDFLTRDTADFHKYIFVYARVVDGVDPAVRQEVQSELQAEGYNVQSVEDTQKALTQIINIMQGIVAALAGVALVAAMFGIINTQYISVLERTREIGIMKALGMSRSTISNLFVLEAIWIGFLGALIGISAGLILTAVLNPWISDRLDLGDMHLLVVDWVQLFGLLLGLMLLAAVAGVLPARKAAKLDPIEALRTE